MHHDGETWRSARGCNPGKTPWRDEKETKRGRGRGSALTMNRLLQTRIHGSPLALPVRSMSHAQRRSRATRDQARPDRLLRHGNSSQYRECRRRKGGNRVCFARTSAATRSSPTRWLQGHPAPPVVPAHPRALYFVSFANSAAARAALPLQPEGWITHAGAAAAVVRANNVVAHAAAAAARHGAQTPSTASRRTEAKPPVP